MSTKVEYPLSVLVENGGDIDEDLSSSLENDVMLQFGVAFCPKTFCKIGSELETVEEVQTFEMDEKEKGHGICFEIFNRLFEKLKEKDLVQEYDLDELACNVSASHPDYPFLKRIDSINTLTHYGIGFNLGHIPKNRFFTLEELAYLESIIEILKEIQPEYPLLRIEKFELQYHLLCQFHN